MRYIITRMLLVLLLTCMPTSQAHTTGSFYNVSDASAGRLCLFSFGVAGFATACYYARRTLIPRIISTEVERICSSSNIKPNVDAQIPPTYSELNNRLTTLRNALLPSYTLFQIPRSIGWLNKILLSVFYGPQKSYSHINRACGEKVLGLIDVFLNKRTENLKKLYEGTATLCYQSDPDGFNNSIVQGFDIESNVIQERYARYLEQNKKYAPTALEFPQWPREESPHYDQHRARIFICTNPAAFPTERNYVVDTVPVYTGELGYDYDGRFTYQGKFIRLYDIRRVVSGYRNVTNPVFCVGEINIHLDEDGYPTMHTWPNNSVDVEELISKQLTSSGYYFSVKLPVNANAATDYTYVIYPQ